MTMVWEQPVDITLINGERFTGLINESADDAWYILSPSKKTGIIEKLSVDDEFRELADDTYEEVRLNKLHVLYIEVYKR